MLPEQLFVSIPFNVYFGWITVATIANITVFLVSINWNGFGIADFVWTILVLIIGAIIGVFRMHKDKSVAYGLVLMWAYFGILLRHLFTDGYAGEYTSIVITLIVCLAIFGFFISRIIFNKPFFNY